jgi:hypothetical protein
MKKLAALRGYENLDCLLQVPVASTASSASVPDGVHRDLTLGISLALPRDMDLRRDFQRSYLDAATWKAFAAPGSHGAAAAALVLDGSNKITAAELRVGVSTDADEVTRCTEVPATGAATASDPVSLEGTDFVHFHAGDAAMSHYLKVEGYRAVHDGRCYAIDRWISGTRPRVYDPPGTLPFANADALRRLHGALAGCRFVD